VVGRGLADYEGSCTIFPKEAEPAGWSERGAAVRLRPQSRVIGGCSPSLTLNVIRKENTMKILLALMSILVVTHGLADEKSKELDRKIIGLLLEKAEAVVHCHKDKSGLVGMDKEMKKRYGLATEETGFWLFVKGTVIGPKIEEEKISFWCTRGAQNDPFLVAEGDYLVFLKRDAQQRWILVADYLGLQPFTKGLDVLVKEIHGKRDL